MLRSPTPLLLLWLSLCAGCSCSPPVQPEIGPVAPLVEPPPAGKAVLIEIVEQNRDTFATPLRDAPRGGRVAVEIRDGRILVDSQAAQESDRARLAAQGIELGPGLASLAQAKVVVAYRLEYAGAGRAGGQVRYYAFSTFPASIALPAAPAGDKIEHRLDRDGAFPPAMKGLRIFPAGGGEIVLSEPTPEGVISLSLAGKSHQLPLAGPVELAQVSRVIQVTEAAVVAEPLVPALDTSPLEIVPRQDHGQVTFSTTLTASSRGVLPIHVRPSAAAAIGK